MGSHINVCAIYGIRLTRTNCFRLGNTTETVQLNKMCVICGIQFTWMNESCKQDVCDTWQTTDSDELFAMRIYNTDG